MHKPRSALIVVDVQRDFCEGGSLAVPGGTRAAERIAGHIARERSRYELVVATADWHIDPAGHFAPEGTAPDFETTWPVHCVADTPGAEFHPALQDARFDCAVCKGQSEAAYSGFDGVAPDGRSLVEVLRGRHIESLVVVGIATDYCVKATVLDAVIEGFDVTMGGDMTAGVDPGSTLDAMDQMLAAGVHIDGYRAAA
jgi:nicotinamidase/pyrazinamidase